MACGRREVAGPATITEHSVMHIATLSRTSASRLALGLGALVLGGSIAGCGHGGAAAANSPSATPDADHQGLKWAQCMRDHGVNIPDPVTSGGGGAAGNGGFVGVRVTPGANDALINPDDSHFIQAQNACKSLLPNGGELTPEQQAQAQENGLKFARCMRSHGIDIPDPKPGTGGVVIRGSSAGGGGGSGPNVSPDDPKFQAAQTACQSLLGNPLTQGGSNLSISKG